MAGRNINEKQRIGRRKFTVVREEVSAGARNAPQSCERQTVVELVWCCRQETRVNNQPVPSVHLVKVVARLSGDAVNDRPVTGGPDVFRVIHIQSAETGLLRRLSIVEMNKEGVELHARSVSRQRRHDLCYFRVAGEEEEARDPEIPVERVEGNSSPVARGRNIRAAGHTGGNHRIAESCPVQVQSWREEIRFVSPVKRVPEPGRRVGPGLLQ